MQRPMGYDIGGGVSKAKEHKKIIKDKAGSLLGYLGEMAGTASKLTPLGMAQEAGKKAKEIVKAKKEQKRRKRFNDRIQMPRPKYERMPLPRDPKRQPKFERMPADPSKKPKYKLLRSGGSVTAKCKLGRNKPTKMY